jgi:MFS family permease
VTAPARSDAARDPGRAPSAEVGGTYSRYVLAVLVVVYILNFLDRQIISILAPDIRADLGIDRAELGFLYGTAFAIFYAIFGIPLGRLADVWTRRSLISLGLTFWSGMTALSGFATGFAQLAAARIGVGVGEASATPAAFSMLTDSFPARVRATVLAVYSSGIYIGAGLGIFIGGQIVERWNRAFPEGGAPFGLAGWQAAFLAVGVPGLLVAIWVRTLREPIRGAADGIYSTPEPHPFRQFGRELLAVVPPLTLFNLSRLGAGARQLNLNLAAAAGIALGAWVLVRLTGSVAQWAALGVGLYAAVSWAQALALRDRTSASLILATPSLRLVMLAFSFLSFTGYGVGFWTPDFFVSVHGVGEAEVGTAVGLTAAFGGLVGITLGGWIADRMRRRNALGRIQVAIAIALAPVPLALWMLGTDDKLFAYVLNFPVSVFASAWIGIGASTVQDLVLPRMRAIASAFYILVLTFIGLALGPYGIGWLADSLGSLTQAMRWGLASNLLAVLLLVLTLRHLARDEASLLERAQAAGEELATGLQP